MNEADLPIWVQFACAALAGLSTNQDSSYANDASAATATADAMMQEFIKRREGIQ